MAPRGVRNNNPGNIEYGPFAQRLGATGSDGRFAIFPSMEAGYAAQERLIGSYMERGLTTPEAIIGRWAPASDGNDVNSYAARVSRALGLQPGQTITPDMVPRLAEAMAEVENGQRVPRVSTTQPLPQETPNPLALPTPQPSAQTTPAAPEAGVAGTVGGEDHQQRLAIIGAALGLDRQPATPGQPGADSQSPYNTDGDVFGRRYETLAQQTDDSISMPQMPQMRRPDMRRMVAALQARRTGRA